MSKFNIYERDWEKFVQENFIHDYFSIDWDHSLCIDSKGIDKSFKNFIGKFLIPRQYMHRIKNYQKID